MTDDRRSRVTIHMAASLDGFVASRDGRVDWLETSDTFDGGEVMTPESMEAFARSIDCYVMGSRTYELALDFERRGLGWAYGDTPTIVLSSRALPTARANVELYAGDLAALLRERLRPAYRNIWVVGGCTVCADCLRLGLADEVRASILPIAIGDGRPFFEGLGADVALHLLEVKAYANGVVALRYAVKR